MRISDWSSDVCSSDLPLHDLGTEPFETGEEFLRPSDAGESENATTAQTRGIFGIGMQVRGEDRQPAEIRQRRRGRADHDDRSEEHTSELQSLMRISYAVFCLKKKNNYLSKQH